MKRHEMVAWLALAAAFSAVLLDLAANLRDAPYDRGTLLAPLLLALSVRRPRAPGPVAPEGRRLRGAGLALLGAGLLVELVGIGGGAWSIARLGLPLATLGLALRLGQPAASVAALSLWLVPIPDAAFELTTPGLEAGLADASTRALRALGVDAVAVGPVVRTAGDSFELVASDNGLHLAHVLSELGWYSAVRRGLGAAVAARRAALGALLAVPAQPAAVLIAIALAAAAHPVLAGAWLVYGVWVLPGTVGIAVVEASRGVGTRRSARAGLT